MWSGAGASQSAGPTGSSKNSAAALANGETKPAGGGGGGRSDDRESDGEWLAARGDVFGESGSFAPLPGSVASAIRRWRLNPARLLSPPLCRENRSRSDAYAASKDTDTPCPPSLPPLSHHPAVPAHHSAGLFPELAGPWRLQTAVARTWGVAYTLDATDAHAVEQLHPTAPRPAPPRTHMCLSESAVRRLSLSLY
jgi:hypothetical protein